MEIYKWKTAENKDIFKYYDKLLCYHIRINFKIKRNGLFGKNFV